MQEQAATEASTSPRQVRSSESFLSLWRKHTDYHIWDYLRRRILKVSGLAYPAPVTVCPRRSYLLRQSTLVDSPFAIFFS